ncbi:XTP/dITP diphosphohydrolase [Pedobacter sp. UYP30]|uniref:RdgB/HAM1 family non-canonical purine NTP pyrophosphatase n=1 Tax=Pedobacter sp. UYP30 TaxID=1756400 RepID=UPI0033925118
MPQLVFATQNEHKTEEIRAALSGQYEILNLNDLDFSGEIEETEHTFAGNASLKSKFVADNFKLDCFADDSGLELLALNGAPGVLSSRYAGTGNSEDNMDLLLKNLEEKTDRSARFKTVISLLHNGENHLFEGIINGTIRTEKAGRKGFGYDAIFQPDGYDITFAEMTMEEKNKISHRALALKKMIDFLKQKR